MGWPERGVPESALPLLQLIQEVQLVYITLRTNKPVTVMCRLVSITLLLRV